MHFYDYNGNQYLEMIKYLTLNENKKTSTKYNPALYFNTIRDT